MTTPWYVGNTGTFLATFRDHHRQRTDAEGVSVTITRLDTGEVVPTEPQMIAHDGLGLYRYDWTPAQAGEYLVELRGMVDGWAEVVPVRVRIREAQEAPVVG